MTLPLQMIRAVFHSPTGRVARLRGPMQKKRDAADWRGFSP
jgi:hypothetical protein